MSRLVVLCVLVLSSFEASAQFTISTLAGSRAGGGWDDGPIATARFMAPTHTVIDSAGNIFVADGSNHNIRRIGRDGQVTTFFGRVPTEDVPYGTPSFDYVSAMTIDANDNLYVSDALDNVVYKLTPAGIRTKLASLPYPQGLAVDKNGNVFVATGDTIRMIKPTGEVSPWAGGASGYADGARLSAKFNFPVALALDSDGTMYVTDGFNHVVRKIALDGTVSTFAGTANRSGDKDGAPGIARFGVMSDITIDRSGNLYAADSDYSVLRRIAPDGTATTVAGRKYQWVYFDGADNANGFVAIIGVTFDRANNSVLIADAGGGTVRRYDPATTAVTTFAGLAPDPARVDGPAEAARFIHPGEAVDDAQGNIYVAELRGIRKIAPSGAVTTIAGGTLPGTSDGTGGAASFRLISSLAMGSDGNLYVGDYSAIRRVTPAGVVTTIAGDPTTSGSADGKGLAARFNVIGGIAFDNAGNLFIADILNGGIRKLDPSGDVTTLPLALDYPVDVAVDLHGDLYIADAVELAIWKISNGDVSIVGHDLGSVGSVTVARDGRVYFSEDSRIARIEPNGSVTDLAGQRYVAGNVDGIGQSARLGSQCGLTFDRKGRLLIADWDNNNVRVGTVTQPVVKRFEATSYVVSPSSASTTLTWYTTALSVSIDGVGDNLRPAGSKTINVSATTTFHLTARGDGGTATSQLTVSAGQLQHRRPTRH